MISPRVTVLMPVYNGERFLHESLQSILCQSFADYEFIIIDDGSTDNSLTIIQSISDSRIQLIRNEINLGLVATLNKGVKLALGEYIARMDQDDVSWPDRLTKQVDFMDNNKHIGVCGSWVRFIPKGNNYIWKLPESSEEIRCWLFSTVGVAHPSVMLRKQLFLDYDLFYTSAFQYIEDYELWVRAIQFMDFANIQEPLLDYRISSGQMCSVYGAEQLAAVAPLRLQRVRELGIDPTPDQQQLHEMIMNNLIPAESLYLDRVEQWLLKLDSANRAIGTYSADCFSRRLLDIWFSICITLADASVCSLRRCLLSPLWAAVNNPVWHRTRAFGAWIVRKIV